MNSTNNQNKGYVIATKQDRIYRFISTCKNQVKRKICIEYCNDYEITPRYIDMVFNRLVVSGEFQKISRGLYKIVNKRFFNKY